MEAIQWTQPLPSHVTIHTEYLMATDQELLAWIQENGVKLFHIAKSVI